MTSLPTGSTENNDQALSQSLVRVVVEIPEPAFRFLNRIADTKANPDRPVGALVLDMVNRELDASPAYQRELEQRGLALGKRTRD